MFRKILSEDQLRLILYNKSNIINVDWINHHIDKEDLEIRYVNKFLGLLAVEIWYRLFITNTLDSETTLD